MADPRGRGFNRGKGRWHRHKLINTQPVNPASLGWTQFDNEQRWYIDDVELVPATEAIGWIAIQKAVVCGIKRVHKFFLNDGMLSRFTNDLLKEVNR